LYWRRELTYLLPYLSYTAVFSIWISCRMTSKPHSNSRIKVSTCENRRRTSGTCRRIDIRCLINCCVSELTITHFQLYLQIICIQFWIFEARVIIRKSHSEDITNCSFLVYNVIYFDRCCINSSSRLRRIVYKLALVQFGVPEVFAHEVPGYHQEQPQFASISWSLWVLENVLQFTWYLEIWPLHRLVPSCRSLWSSSTAKNCSVSQVDHEYPKESVVFLFQ